MLYKNRFDRCLFVSAASASQPATCSPVILDFLPFCDYHTVSHVRTFTYAVSSHYTEPLSHLSTYLLDPTQVTRAL